MGVDESSAVTGRDWVVELKSGRPDAIAALRERIRRGLAAAFHGRSGFDEADLDDFTQESVLRVLERLDSFRGDSSFTTWAMAVAVRVGLTTLRRRRWPAGTVDVHLAQVASKEPRVDARDARGDLLAALRDAIRDQLTPRQRKVLLAELEGIPQVVLADRLAATPGAIYKASHDARKKLKGALAARGYDAPAVREILGNDS